MTGNAGPILVCAPTAAELPKIKGNEQVVTGVLERLGRSSVDRWADLVEKHGPSATILVGAAGGLSPALEFGDGALATVCRHTEGEAAFTPSLVETANKAAETIGLKLKEGPVLTVDRIYSPADKDALLAEKTDAIALEMEGYWIARAALEKNHDLVMLRIVLDAGPEDLSGFAKLSDNEGRVHNWKVILAPSLWPKLPGMAGRMKQLRLKLERWVRAILTSRAGF